MHIAFLTPEYPYKSIKSAGIGNYIKNLSDGLVHSNISVTVFVYGQNKDEACNDGKIKIIRIKQKNYSAFSWFLNRKRIQKIVNKTILKEGINVVEAPEWTGITAFMNFKAPLVLRLHGSDTYFCHLEHRPQKKKNYWFEKWALINANYIVSVSEFAAKLTTKLFKLTTPIKVIHNGVDCSQFHPSALPENENTILYFGTLIRKKGVLELAHIFNEVVKKNDKANLLLLGKDVIDAKENKSTKKIFINTLSSKAIKNVKFINEVPYQKVKEYLAKATVVVLPSFAEAFPMTWLEAMAQGKALVTSNIGWANELMINGKTGYTEHPKNHKEFAAKIGMLLANEKLRNEFGENALNRILTCFSMSIIVKKNIDFFKSIVEKEC